MVAPPRTRARRLGYLVGWRRFTELRRVRQAADAEILRSEAIRPRLAWRVAELTGPKNRLALARSIRRLIRSADGRYLPGATPLSRIAVRGETELLTALANRLSDLDQPVTARGILLLDQLLTDGYGPLFVSYRASELSWTLTHIAERLAPSS